MQTFRLTDEFTAVAEEKALIAAVAQSPTLYWELIDLVHPGVFTEVVTDWQQLAAAIEHVQPIPIPEWEPASDPHATARLLADLYQRRLLASLQERLAAGLYSDQPAAELATFLEGELGRVQASIRETQAGQLLWGSDLLPEVLMDAEARRRAREETGKAITGLSSGIGRLDELLNGFNSGLYILAGPPGMGKTTLALQIAAAVTPQVPVVYVTFENSPANLILKAVCARANINMLDVQRGRCDLSLLQAAANSWQPVAGRIAFIEGVGRLSMAQVRAKVLQAMNHHKSDQCLVIVDYLQLWAKAADELRMLSTVRERVETLGTSLRELALRLGSPVLALASQNRAQGDYGNGKGAAALDSLKESGDLEYAADVVLFLTPASEKRHAMPPARAVDLTISKNRNGDIGKAELVFRPDIGTLREEAR